MGKCAKARQFALLFIFSLCLLSFVRQALIQVGLIFQSTNRLSEWDGGVLLENEAMQGKSSASYSNPHIENDCAE